ncbi:MAG TPA: non-heme iron oxygenase ferredoxin subunit [Acidimicrobiales bacterium]|nr:non-heme iron oxygenase ferredoxin subunit [Acidimicrobiales bacterium]
MSELARLPLAELPDKVGTHRVETSAGAVCIVRIDDRFYAIGDRCSHAEVSLSEGDVDPVECSIECWKHGSAFSLIDGEPQSLPATVAVPVYRVTVDGAEIVVGEP